MKTSHLVVAASLVLLSACYVVRSRAYGKPMPSGEFIVAKTVLNHPEMYAGKRVKLEGVVASVCPTKGCWMVIADGDRQLRVTFEDYGFFMPKDCAGSIAKVEGQLASDGLSLVASSVVIQDN